MQECQAIAWKEGDHRNVCKLKQQERTGTSELGYHSPRNTYDHAEGKMTKVSKRDSAFFHAISVFDVHKNIRKLRERAKREYPDSLPASFVVLIDFSVTPAVYNLKPIEQYSRDGHSTTAQARNDAIIESARDYPELLHLSSRGQGYPLRPKA